MLGRRPGGAAGAPQPPAGGARRRLLRGRGGARAQGAARHGIRAQRHQAA